MLRKSHVALAVNLVLGLAGGASALGPAKAQAPAYAPSDRPATAVIRDVNGAVLGTLQIDRYDATKSRVTVNVRGLTPGFHAFHVHSTGVCDAKSVDAGTGSAFTSAGGHLEPGPMGDAAGNLPSLLAAADGTANASFLTDRLTVGRIKDADGSAIIIHAKSDNFANIPDRYTHPKDDTGTTGPDATTLKTGDAGRRVACGIIRVPA